MPAADKHHKRDSASENRTYVNLRQIPTVVLILLLATAAAAEDVSQPPETKRYSVGIGYAGSTIDVDTSRDGDKQVILDGWGVRGRMELKKRWALQFRYLSAEEGFSSGGKLSLDQFDVQANFKWYESEKKYFHMYAKFGLAWTDFEERIPLTGTFSDQALGPAVGIGLEWGPPRYAFFVDFGVTFVNVELIPGDSESLTVGNTITGFTYRF